MSDLRLAQLARKMIYLERKATVAARQGCMLEASEFLAEREQVATNRSQLMRDLWAERREHAVKRSIHA